MKNNNEQTNPTPIPPYLKLSKDQKDLLTKNLKNNLKIRRKKEDLPIMEISMEHLCEIMGIQSPVTNDKVVFTLASYRSNEDLKRYNDKAKTSWKIDQLEDRPTILVSLQKDGLISEDFYDVATIKPPPEDTV